MTAIEDAPGPGEGPTGNERPLSDAARAVLQQRGIDPDWAATERGVYEVLTDDEVPEELRGNPLMRVPALVFSLADAETGVVVPQGRPHHPFTREDGSSVKYVLPEDHFVNLALVRPARTEKPRVSLIVEGTVQSLAASYDAADDVAVYMIPGCWGWSAQRTPTGALARLAGTEVIGILDADAATNRDVYDAGARLADAVESMAGAEMRFVRLGAGGTTGYDDLRAGVPEERRAEVLDHMIGAARKKPADRAPEKKKRRSGALGHATFAGGLTDPNDTAIATTWAEQGATARWRLLLEADAWLGYRLGRWERTSQRAPYDDLARWMHETAQAYIARAQQPDTDAEDVEKLEEAARLLMAHNKITTALARAQGHSDFFVRMADLDRHPSLWPAGNGVLDLLDGEFREHDPELMLTVGSDVIFDPEAQCPRFDAFLADILRDPEVRAYVMRLFGVAMFGEVRANAQVFTVFVGEGRNGKGALVRTMERLFGRMSVTLDAESLLEQKHREHSQEVAKLAGKRLAIAQEPVKGKGWNTGRIKSWTGGDRLTGRFMRQDDFEFEPSHTLIVTANERPPVPRSDSAFWMRYREVPFEVSVEGREDAGLEAHIAEHELPGVLNRVLAGLADYLRHGLAEPAAVRAATHEAQVESDHLAVFAETHLVVTGHEEDRLLASEVFESCRKWWAQHVRHEAMPADRGRSNFTSQLQRVLGIREPERNPRKAKIEGSSRLAWHGLRWLDDGGDAPLPGLPTTSPGAAPGHGNLPEDGPALPDGPEAEEPAPEGGLPKTSPDVAEDEGGSATDDTLTEQGEYADVADVADVADIERLSTHQEENASDTASESESTTHVSPRALITEISGNRATATLPEATTGPVVFDIETGDSAALYTHPDPEAYVRIGATSNGRETRVHTGPGPVLDHVLTSRKVIGHNVLGFDLLALGRVDPRCDVLALTRAGRVFDTMLVEERLNPVLGDGRAGAVGRAQKALALNAVAERYGVPGKVDDLKGLAKTHGGFDAIPVDDEAYRAYVAGDVDATVRVAAAQSAELGRRTQTERDYIVREHRVHAIAATMGAQGLAVDRALLDWRFWHGYGRKQDLTRSLIEQYGIPTVKADGKPADSPAATKDGKRAVLRALHGLGAHVEWLEKTKSGAPAFGREPMARFAQLHEGHPNGEAIGALCAMMGDVAGVRTVYSTALEHLHDDGRVHPVVATLQASGRWSVQKPGLTVFGKRGGRVIERGIFTATDDEHVLFTADFSQIDQRAVAVHSQDPAYMDLFAPGRDSHAEVARRVWGSDARRSDAKVIGHGWNYGMGVAKLAATVGGGAEGERTAAEFDAAMREQFPRLVAWREEVREEAVAKGWVDNGFGRRMLVDRDRAHTQAPALMGQGGARDLAMEALLAMDDDLVRKLRAFVHDEIVVECRRDEVDEVKAAISEAMNFEWCPEHGTRPIRIEAEPGPVAFRWSDAY